MSTDSRTGHRITGRPDTQANPDDPDRVDGRHVAGRARPDDRLHLDPDHRRRPARPVGQAWVTTAYLITSTVTTPLYGKLSDIYGRRPMFLTAISIFIFGSILCTFATSMYELAAFRAMQGIGAGGLFSMALAILADIVPPRERAKYQGYFLAVFGMSSVIGPLVGGFFAGTEHHPGHHRLALGVPGQRADRHHRAGRRRDDAAPPAHPAPTTGSTGGAPPR